jgi:hypothetical protein
MDASGYNSTYQDTPITYDSNGYITSQASYTPQTNPWVALANGSQADMNTANNAAAGIPGMQQQVSQQQASLQAYGTQTAPAAAPAAYPAMANDFGLGSQQNNAPVSNPTQGNPYMLKGDALSR